MRVPRQESFQGPSQEKNGQNGDVQPELDDEAGMLPEWLDSMVTVSAKAPPQ